MNPPNLSRDAINRFHHGDNHISYRTFGAHLTIEEGIWGVRFTLWAPHARIVSVVGDFNGWDGANSIMGKTEYEGIWSLFIPSIGEGFIYKYEIINVKGEKTLKADPYGFYSEKRPATASIVFDIDTYKWSDYKYLMTRNAEKIYEKPMNIYEVHLGSWKRNGMDFKTYLEFSDELVEYVVEMGYTHIELLPVMEHPLDASWGYQVTGYYSVTSRFGTPRDFMYFIDRCHLAGIGVIIDWVPGHFCKDDHGLRLFDGTPLYEYKNHDRSENRGWGTLNFDHGKPEIRSFLISNAYFYFDVYHVDGIRIDAVAAMLYLGYGKKEGEWKPNIHGGRENLESVGFMKKLNEVIFHNFPSALMMAEESTSWPMVTKPVYLGGLGYNYKWNMGWMNDVLKYFEMDSVYRKWHHNLITFSFMYTLSENYVLPLSHDEVVHEKRSLLNKIPGDYWQKFAGLRALYAYMYIHPGKKLIFMGGEFGQFIEWDFDRELDWLLLGYDMHKKLQYYVKTLNRYYLESASLNEVDHEYNGYDVIDANDSDHSILVIGRYGKNKADFTIAVCNFSPQVHHKYRIGVPNLGEYVEVLNSDHTDFGGSGQINNFKLIAEDLKWHNKKYSLEITVPPLGAVYIRKL